MKLKVEKPEWHGWFPPCEFGTLSKQPTQFPPSELLTQWPTLQNFYGQAHPQTAHLLALTSSHPLILDNLRAGNVDDMAFE